MISTLTEAPRATFDAAAAAPATATAPVTSAAVDDGLDGFFVAMLLIVTLAAAGTAAAFAWLWRRAEDRAARTRDRAAAARSAAESAVVGPADESFVAGARTDRADDARMPAHRAIALDLIALDDALDGSTALRSQTRRALGRLHVHPLALAVGDAFDGNVHAASDRTATNDRERHGKVAEVVRDGWMRGGTLVRAADVTVWVAQ